MAISHVAIMEAVYGLLQEMPAGDLTMDAVAKRAGVGKPTLYKWWPSKAALVVAMFHERLGTVPELPEPGTTAEALRVRMRFLITQCNGLFGKVVADLIAEGQNDDAVSKDFYERHVAPRRAATAAIIEQGIASGELLRDTDPELLMDAMFGPVYLRLLLHRPGLTQDYGRELVEQALRGHRNPKFQLRRGPAKKSKR